MPNFTEEEEKRIGENLSVIREYLQKNFPNYTIQEASDLSVSYTFSVTNLEQYKSYIFKVSGSRLSDKNNIPAKTQAALERDNVAIWMIKSKGEFVW
jgi:hypothetical protein